MKKDEFILSGLLELYALGISSPEESRVVEEHLVLYPELREELDVISGSLENYAMANAVTPPEAVKQKVMQQVFGSAPDEKAEGKTKAVSRSATIIKMYKIAVAALIILLVGSAVLTYNYYNKFQHTSAELVTTQNKIKQEQLSKQALASDLDVITNRYTQPVVLKGTPNYDNAVAKIFWMKNTGQVYVDPRNLPAPPEGFQYQLWAIVDGKPQDAGLITTEKGTYSIQRMKSFGKADAFAITLEKAGGSATPTLEKMVVISQL